MENNPYKNIPCEKCKSEWRCKIKNAHYDAVIIARFDKIKPPDCMFFEEIKIAEKGAYNED